MLLKNFTHKLQADAPARDTIGRLRFKSRTLGLVIWNDMDGGHNGTCFEARRDD